MVSLPIVIRSKRRGHCKNCSVKKLSRFTSASRDSGHAAFYVRTGNEFQYWYDDSPFLGAAAICERIVVAATTNSTILSS